MPAHPSVVVFDVNETLSDMSPMADRFADVGVPGALAATWFNCVLRDGFALALSGASPRFAALAEEELRQLLSSLVLEQDLDEAVVHILSGFYKLKPHSDVVGGVRALRAAGLRLFTLSNGSTAIAESLLKAAGIRDDFEQVLSTDDVGIWKPAAPAYGYAARCCGVPPETMIFVAVHPWDIDGAARAGLTTAWVNRNGGPYPAVFERASFEVSTMGELVSFVG